MEALISNIKFERINDDNCYWKLTLVDKEGKHIGTFGIMIKAEYFKTLYVTGQVYYGFGYPLS